MQIASLADKLPRYALLCLVMAAVHSKAAETVATESGLVSGSGKEVRVFRGIPYAAPPVGELRWKPPQPAAHWDGVHDASEFGPPCPQPFTGMKLPQQHEGCLTLNIWTPATNPRRRLPVILSIHGGGFVAGWSGLPAYDGESFARQGIVFVSLNYRLGALGFLAHPGLSQESPHHSSGNYGLLDQVRGLEWIQRNISAFGGDPKQVTILGESAGGSSVCYLLVSPLSKGLFRRAISESAWGLYLPISHRAQAWYGRQPAEQTGMKLDTNLAALRALSTDDLLEKLSPAVNPALPKGVEFQPIVDGWVLPDDPAVLFESGAAHHVPVIAGTNSDDGGAIMMMTKPVVTLAGYQAYLQSRFGEASDRASGLFPVKNNADTRRTASQVATDASFLYGTSSLLLALSRANKNVYWYQFTRVDEVSRKMGGFGAFHGAEMGYVFGDPTKSLFAGSPLMPATASPPDEIDLVLAKTMNGAWVQFAKTGNPNAKQLPHWPSLNPRDPQYLEYGDLIHVERGLRTDQLNFLSDFYGRQRRARAKTAN